MDTVAAYAEALFGVTQKAGELGVLQMCVRAVAVYIVLIGYVRFAKKRFLSKATAFDAILVIIIGSVASRAISGNAPFFGSLAAAFVLILLHWVISYVTELSQAMSFLVKGRDSMLVKNGRVNRAALRQEHMSDDDLAEDLRQEGVAGLAEVKEARLERSGQVSVIKRKS